MTHAIIRGKNGRRHEVDFGDSPVRVEVYASEETIEIFVEADFETLAEERRIDGIPWSACAFALTPTAGRCTGTGTCSAMACHNWIQLELIFIAVVASFRATNIWQRRSFSLFASSELELLLTIEHIRSGGLRPLAVTGTTRSELLPEIPTVSEFVPGFEASQWIGIGAPKNTPMEIINRLDHEINSGLADASVKARIIDLGGTVLPGSPGEFGEYIANETEKWAKVIKFADIKPE